MSLYIWAVPLQLSSLKAGRATADLNGQALFYVINICAACKNVCCNASFRIASCIIILNARGGDAALPFLHVQEFPQNLCVCLANISIIVHGTVAQSGCNSTEASQVAPSDSVDSMQSPCFYAIRRALVLRTVSTKSILIFLQRIKGKTTSEYHCIQD